jgi:hypothetical protein
MNPRLACRTLAVLALGLGTIVSAGAGPSSLLGGTRHPDPAQVVPLDQIAPAYRDSVAEVIRDHSFHRQGAPDTFPCHPQVYLNLLNEPALTLALWQDLSATPARLRQVGPHRYEGTDGSGTTATWEFVLRSPRLHVLLCDLNYVGPRGNTRLEGRIVLIVRSGFFKEVDGEPWVQHDVEAFVKIDSKGWKTVAKTVRPLIEKLLEDQVQEAGWFVSLMGRLVEGYPNWAAQITRTQAQIPTETRQGFLALLSQTRRPGAFTGRPMLADSQATKTR